MTHRLHDMLATWSGQALASARRHLEHGRHHNLASAAALLQAIVEAGDGYGVTARLAARCSAAGAPVPPWLADRTTRAQSKWLRRRGLPIPAKRAEACVAIADAKVNAGGGL